MNTCCVAFFNGEVRRGGGGHTVALLAIVQPDELEMQSLTSVLHQGGNFLIHAVNIAPSFSYTWPEPPPVCPPLSTERVLFFFFFLVSLSSYRNTSLGGDIGGTAPRSTPFSPTICTSPFYQARLAIALHNPRAPHPSQFWSFGVASPCVHELFPSSSCG